jgi:NADH dehydrogenase FAD-containing subunit
MIIEEMILPDPTLVPQERIAPMLAQLAALQTALAARLIAGHLSGHEQSAVTQQDQEDLLTPGEAAALLTVSVDWMYRHAAGLPFTRRLSRKALRFSRAGLLKWRAGRRT